jgi:hypothetical protein
LHQLRQPGAADVDAGIAQALVLPVQRQVECKLVDHHAGDEAPIGTAAIDDARRRWRTGQGLRVAPLDHRPHILEDHVAARALCQAMAHLLANDLVVVRR